MTFSDFQKYLLSTYYMLSSILDRRFSKGITQDPGEVLCCWIFTLFLPFFYGHSSSLLNTWEDTLEKIK